MKIISINYFILIFLFILKEIKNTFELIKRVIYFIKNHQIIGYFCFNFFNKKNINFSRNKFFKLYTKENQKTWTQNNLPIKNEQKKIIVSCFVHNPGYYLTNGIIAKYLEHELNLKLVGLIDKNDFQGEFILRSFGVNEFFYIKKGNFFKRFKFFLSAIKIIKNIKSIDEFLNYKKESIHLGKIVYEHVLRHTGKGTINKLNFKFYYHLAETLKIQEYYLTVLKENNIRAVIQSEQQFIPSCIIFQNSLKNNIDVFSRRGGPQWVTVKKYSNISQAYEPADEVEKDLFDYIFNNFKEKASEKGSIVIKKRFFGEEQYNYINDGHFNFKGKKEITRSELCNLLSWDYKKPICIVFGHCLIDGNFLFGWRLFKDNLTRLRETLATISKNDKINWLIKPHPAEIRYPETSTNTIAEVTKFYKNFKNIKLFPKNLSSMTIANSVNAIVSCTGSGPLEFASFGIPSIIAGRSMYSKLEFAKQPKTVHEYKTLLENVDKLDKLNKTQIEKANTFTYIMCKLIRVKIPLLPKFKVLLRWLEYDNNFWKDSISALKNYSFKNDYFRKMFLLQLKNENRHIINQEFLNKELKLY